MEILTGRPVSPGYAKGEAVVYNGGRGVEIPRYHIGQADVDNELERFRQALERSRSELRQLEQRVLSELGQTYSNIFSAHLALLHDRQFTEQVRQRVRGDLVNVEQALDGQVADLARLLGSLENEYLRERAHDIRDLGKRLMRQLTQGESQRYARLAPRSVIVARELLPSETIDLDREHVVAVVTEEGGENSHAAILARALGIPAVTAVSQATDRIPQGAPLLVDGGSGQIIIAPTADAAENLKSLKNNYDHVSAAAAGAELEEPVTLDGVRVSLLANLNRAAEAQQVAAHHLDGVGLFRTEFLYMDSPAAPSYERQLEVYQRLLDRLGNKPLVIRTLDLGGDKLPLFVAPHHEENPNLGSRGLRFSLARPELFRTQLQALLAASRGGDLRILFPMVLGQDDLAAAVGEVRQLVQEMGLTRPPRLGAMIETPSALFSLQEICEQVDFVSIGTNDLTQYMLAADRDAAELADDYSVLHPSVLRAVSAVVQACGQAGRELCVCGEAAGDAGAACLLVGLGIRQLSMSPVRAARVRLAIQLASCNDLIRLANQALRADSTEHVQALLQQYRDEKLKIGKPE